MKVHKNQTLWFSSTLMTPGTGKFAKIRRFDFLQLSWPRVHASSQKSDVLILFNFHDPGYRKIHKNQTLWFYSIFMTPGTGKPTKIRCFDFLQFSWPHVHKNQTLRFLQLSWPRVLENIQNSDTTIFFNFHDPGYMKVHKNQTLWFYSIFMTPGTGKFTKIRCFNFLHFSWPRVH